MGNVTNFGNKLFASKCMSEARYISFKVTESSYQIMAYKNVFFSDFDEQEYKIEKHNGERAFLLWGKIIFSVAQVAKTTKGGQLQRIRHCNDAVIIIDIIIIKTTKMMIDDDFSFCDRNEATSRLVCRVEKRNSPVRMSYSVAKI